METIKLLILGIIVIIELCLVLSGALGKTINNNDVMLCESALKSGNENYQEKCQCYYKGESIDCLAE